MLQSLLTFETSCTDPYRNLATEKYLLEHIPQDSCILYLWQNQNTVVIGRNQNPWAECRISLLEQEGGRLARRLSGGGAVFHDLGNLNFTFLTSTEHHDLTRQFSAIQAACNALGIPAELSGRNDLLVHGLKFSGNAFYHRQGCAYHHGTLLVDADMEKLSRYLSPPKAKLEAKGIASVRSRVTNLSSITPGLTCDMLKSAMQAAFSQVYDLPVAPMELGTDADNCIEKDTAANSSWDWLYGKPLPFSMEFQEKFLWGYIQLQLHVERGIIRQAKVYTDAMDWTLPLTLESILRGACLSPETLRSLLSTAPLPKEICDDIQALFRKHIL